MGEGLRRGRRGRRGFEGGGVVDYKSRHSGHQVLVKD